MAKFLWGVPLAASTLRLLLPLWLLLAATGGFAAPQAEAPRLDQDRLPARGDAHTLLHIDAFSRYTILARSAQGVALQLVDRMAGPGPLAGEAGQQDGRLDPFLEKGDYLLRTLAGDKGGGQVALRAVSAVELSSSPAPRLVEYRIEHSSLDDLQQRSYWLMVDKARSVTIEAAGRNLADLRLWKDGSWLVDAEPTAAVATPAPGRPLAERLLTARLEPGLYRLTAYGGPAQPWAESSSDHPLYLRLGIPALPESGRQRYVAGPFGVDRWRVPGTTDYFRLELPQAESASLGLADYTDDHPFQAPDQLATIDKKSLPPVTELRVASRPQGERLLSVSRAAGQPYVLQHFPVQNSVRIDRPGDYWVSTLQSGHGEDDIDLTAIAACWAGPCRGGASAPGTTLVADSAIPLDQETGWRRRFNLLAQASLFFHVRALGNYRFTIEGVRAELRLEPFMTRRPEGYQAPEPEDGTLARTLDPGYYVLTLAPRSASGGKGVVTLSVVPAGTEAAPPSKPSPAQTGFTTRLSAAPKDDYRITLNQQPGLTHTLVVRRLPIDLGQALPLNLAAHGGAEVRVRVPETGSVSALAEDGSTLPLNVDGRDLGGQEELEAGEYTIALQNPGEHPLECTLALAPRRLSEDSPLPPIPADALNSRPSFPLLDSSQPQFFEVDRGQSTTVDLHVDRPAFYRLESTGLLRTEGNLRTRTLTSLDRESANGVGRNFLIDQYLGQGEYQLSTRPLGQSHGPFGLRLTQKVPEDGGELMAGIRARHSLSAGEGLSYRFHVATAGDYRLYAMGLGRQFRARLDDADGWPLVRPGAPADFQRHFEPGDYRLVILPQPVDARVVTLFAPVPEARRFEGHGPHDIALDEPVQHRWLEPADGAPRVPDLWRFDVPAPVTATIDLARGMSARLLRDGATLAEVIGGTPWKGELAAGGYMLEAASAQPNNRFDYQLRVHSEELVAGETRTLQAPAEIAVSVGTDAPVELASLGDQDVRARLFDDKGNLVVENDDRADDWNFLISRRLPAGRYRLQVDPVGTATATTTLGMRLPAVHPAEPLALPAKWRITDADVHYYSLPAAAPGRLWGFAAHTHGGAGMALEYQHDGRWQGLGQQTGPAPRLLLPLGAAGAAVGEYRLRVWKLTRDGDPLALTGAEMTVQPQTESSLAQGVTLTRFDALDPPLGVAAVRLERPGQLELAKATGVLWGSGTGHTLEAPQQGRMSASVPLLWLARISHQAPAAAPDLAAGGADRISARRMVLDSDQPLAVGLAPHAEATLDLAPLAGAGTQLVLAESPTGAPGIRAAATAPGMSRVAVDEHSAIWLGHRAGPSAVRLRDSEDGKVGLPLQLRLYRFAAAPPRQLAAGSHDLSLDPRASVQLHLPGGHQRLRLTLPAGAAAELIKGDGSLATFWSGAAPQSFDIDTEADGLALYNTRDLPGQAALLALPAPPTPALDGSRFGRYHFAAAGTRALALHLSATEKTAGRRLHLEGPVEGLSIIESSGRILRGDAPLLHDDALLSFRHGPGFVLVWLTDAAGESAVDAKLAARPVRLPVTLKLNAEASALRLDRSAPGAVALHSDVPLIVRVRSPGRPEALRLFSAAADLPLYLPSGASTLLLDGLTAAPPGGTLSLRPMAAELVAEGLSTPRMLAPGDSRLYHFHLDEARTVGVGVKASVDRVGCTLLDAGGRKLGQGLLLMRHLDEGDYLLRIEAPADSDTLQVQAALVGTRPPGNGPPPEVIRQYLQAAGLKPE